MMMQMTMTKKGSPHVVTFTVDEDPHFMNVEVKKRTTGAVRATHYIVRSDLATWLEYFESQGFTIVEPNSK